MNKIGDKIHVGTKNYIACEDYTRCCKGCVAENDPKLCNDIVLHADCETGIIWIKQQPVETQATTFNETKGEPEMNNAKIADNTTEEPKYTLAEFLEAYNVWGQMTDRYDEMESVIKEYLECKNNPKYQEFLSIEQQYFRLKAIFG